MLAQPRIDVQRTPVTLLIALIAAAIELVSQLEPERRMFFYNELKLGIWWQVWLGELWRPVTTTMLHGGLIHAAFNIYWLSVFGPAVEEELGSPRTATLFVLLAYVSTMPQYLLSGFFDPTAGAMVGLSGVVYGFFGICLMGGRRGRPGMAAAANPMTSQLMVAWLVLCLVLGAVEQISGVGLMSVANTAHVAGLVFGVLYGQALFERSGQRLWVALAVAASLVVLSTLVGLPGHPNYEIARHFAGRL